MTDEELSDIETRANAATHGPWGASFPSDPVTIFGGDCDCRGYPDSVAVAAKPDSDRRDENCPHLHWVDDMKFIAHAREDIPRLIAEVRRLRAALLDIRETAREGISNLQRLESNPPQNAVAAAIEKKASDVLG